MEQGIPLMTAQEIKQMADEDIWLSPAVAALSRNAMYRRDSDYSVN